MPLVGGFGFLDGSVILVNPGVGLGGTAHVARQGADRENNRRKQPNLGDHATRGAMSTTLSALLGTRQLVVMRAVHVTTMSRPANHATATLFEWTCGCRPMV